MTIGRGKAGSSPDVESGFEEASDVNAPAPDSAPAKRARRAVLLVEDDPMIRIPIATALKRKGWSVVSSSDGLEALQVLAARRDEIGVVVLDLVMPRKDGLATFHELRKLDTELPVILTSGLSDDARVGTMLSLGVREFLPKPYDVEDLLSALSRAFG